MIRRTRIPQSLSGSKFLSSSILFPYKDLKYNSVELDVNNIHVNDTSEFASKLFMTVVELKEVGKSAVFLKIPTGYAHYIPIAEMYGFNCHHAINKTITMTLWLHDTASKIPVYSTHHCGAGGVVVADKLILLIREKHSNLWKLPGGYVNQGEDFGDAVQREIFEETGVRTKFEKILTIRHEHDVQFGKSDLYFICGMKPLSREITIDSEIEDAKWIDVSEFTKSNQHPMLQVITDILLNDESNGNDVGLREEVFPSTRRPGKSYKLYLPFLNKK